MIKQYFNSTKAKSWYDVTPPRQLTPPPVDKHSLSHTSRELAQALKLGISVEVYQHRCRKVSEASNLCKLQLGDTVWPVKPSDLTQYGQMLVVGICRHYDQYGTVDWNDNPFILTLACCRDRSVTATTTYNWADKKEAVLHVC